jgi:hypothetical protein
MSVVRQWSAGKMMAMRGDKRTLPCQAYFQQRSFTTSGLQVAHSSQAPLTIAPRTILDSTHSTLNAYYTCARAHAQQAGTEIPCVSHEGEKRSAVKTHTEYGAQRSAVIRCGDGAQMFLACSVPRIYSTKEGARKHLSVNAFGQVEENTATHP